MSKLGFCIAGSRYVNSGDKIDSLEVGDQLSLVADTRDVVSIRVGPENDKVGYVPIIYSRELAEMIYRGHRFSCVVNDKHDDHDPDWRRVYVLIEERV